MMEQEKIENHIFEFDVNEETKNQISGLSQWMQINAIVAFVSLALSLITTVITYVKYSAYLGMGSFLGSSGVIKLLVSTVLSVLLNLLLIQSAGNIKKGLALSDQGYFNLGLSKMATYFKTMGILIIVVLSFMVLVFFFSLLRLF
jgi:Family of unknown function (DUF5362)